MELWIRSQDRTTLIRSYEIYIAEYGINSYVIRAKRTSYILGAYDSFERALEVLDEIQQILCPKKPKAIIGKNVEFIPSIVYVYEMPKD